MTRLIPRPVGIAMLVAGVTAVAFAQGGAPAAPVMNLKMGLWELTSTVNTAGGPQIDTSKMDAATKKALLDALQSSMNKPIVTKTCFTKETFSKWMFEGQAGETCTATVTVNTATRFVFDRKCTGKIPRADAISIDAAAPDHFTETVHSLTTTGGMTSTSDVTIAAKWQAADCGTVK